MGKQQFIEHLVRFGLTRQEASIYYSLLIEGKQSGYEIAKGTGISRSNAYNSLAALVEKGAAYVVEESAKRYIPVPLEEFCDNEIRKKKEEKDWLLSHIPNEKVEEEGYITIEGIDHILDKVKNLLEKVEERVYISCTDGFLNLIEGEITALLAKGKKVVIITDKECSFANARVYLSEDKGMQIGIISDSRYVLTGEYGAGSMNTCLYSGQTNFVTLFKSAMANEIKLITLQKGEVVK